jgi:hypothetical protein
MFWYSFMLVTVLIDLIDCCFVLYWDLSVLYCSFSESVSFEISIYRAI